MIYKHMMYKDMMHFFQETGISLHIYIYIVYMALNRSMVGTFNELQAIRLVAMHTFIKHF